MRSLGCPRSARWLVVAAALAVAPMAGAGPKPLAVVAAPPSPANGLPQEGDFNGDGIDEVTVSSKRGGFVSVLLGDGIGATCPTATALGL
jgi:hypothetical protein